MNNWHYIAAFLVTAFPGARNLILLLDISPFTIADYPLMFELWFASGLFGGLTFFLAHFLVRTLQLYSKLIKPNIYNLGSIYVLPAIGAKLALLILAFFYLNLPLNVNEEILSFPSTIFFKCDYFRAWGIQ